MESLIAALLSTELRAASEGRHLFFGRDSAVIDYEINGGSASPASLAGEISLDFALQNLAESPCAYSQGLLACGLCPHCEPFLTPGHEPHVRAGQSLIMKTMADPPRQLRWRARSR